MGREAGSSERTNPGNLVQMGSWIVERAHCYHYRAPASSIGPQHRQLVVGTLIRDLCQKATSVKMSTKGSCEIHMGHDAAAEEIGKENERRSMAMVPDAGAMSGPHLRWLLDTSF